VKILLPAVSFAIVGCAATGNVVSSPDGTFTTMRRGDTFAASTSPLRVQALKDADAYCAARGRKANVIHAREIPAIGHWPEAEVSFTCD
jgi:hypothetical protein